MISPEPDVLSFELDDSEYLLLLSCDGVWDSLSEQAVYSHVAQFVCKNSQESKPFYLLNYSVLIVPVLSLSYSLLIS